MEQNRVPNDSLETVRYSLESSGLGAEEIEQLKLTGQSLLHVAAGYGRINLTSYLLKRGADPNAQNSEGQSPLHNACCHGHFHVSSKLIAAGANVDLMDLRGWTPMHCAVARKANLNGLTNVYWKVVDLLLENGANPYLKSTSGRTVLSRIKDDEARRAVQLKFLLKKLSQIDDNDADEKARIINKHLSVTDFFELVKIGDENLEVLKVLTTTELLRSRLENFDNITPLHRAAGYNHLNVARWFIQEGARVDASDNWNRIPLHNAAQYGHVEMIELLVENCSDINKKDLIGYTPLHVAADNKTFTACYKLIELGADTEAKCNAGKLPYDLAETDDVKEVLKPEALQHRLNLIPSSSTQAVYIDMLDPPDENAQPSIPDELMLDSYSDQPLFTNAQHHIKKEQLAKTDPCYQLLKRRMLETVVKHSGDLGGLYTSYEIISIERILNKKVWSRYQLGCQRLELEHGPGRRNERLLFHGSKFVDKIILDGFDARYAQSKGMFGAGLYFAEHSSKSNQYTFGLGNGCKDHLDKSCYICERAIIYAQVALGKTHTSKEAMPDCVHGPPGWSSVKGSPESTDNLLYPEYVIYNGDQAYPLYLIRYRIKL